MSNNFKSKIKPSNNSSSLNKLAKIGAWKFDLIKKELIWDDEIYNIFEINKNDYPSLDTKELFKLIKSQNTFSLFEKYGMHLITKKPYSIIHKIETKNNTIKYIEERCNTTYDENGKFIESNGTYQDITELRKSFLEENLEFNSRKEIDIKKSNQLKESLNVLNLSLSYLELMYIENSYDNNKIKSILNNSYKTIDIIINSIDISTLKNKEDKTSSDDFYLYKINDKYKYR